MSRLTLRRLYLPFSKGGAIIAAEGIGHDTVVLTIEGGSRGEDIILTLTAEEWKALSNMYYDLGIWAPLPGDPRDQNPV